MTTSIVLERAPHERTEIERLALDALAGTEAVRLMLAEEAAGDVEPNPDAAARLTRLNRTREDLIQELVENGIIPTA